MIGTIALLKYKNFNFGVLKRFAVKKEYRRKGVGKKLIGTLIEFAKSKKLNSIILQTTTEMVAANKVYEKFGFKKIEKPGNVNFSVILPTTIFYELKINFCGNFL